MKRIRLPALWGLFILGLVPITPAQLFNSEILLSDFFLSIFIEE
jgi:hypothetical protein